MSPVQTRGEVEQVALPRTARTAGRGGASRFAAYHAPRGEVEQAAIPVPRDPLCATRPSRSNQSGAPMAQKHVAVLMGGWSAERDVSLRSGKACADVLERQGFRVTRIDVDRNVAAALTSAKPDVALNLLHWRPGGDGASQGLLVGLYISYTP